MDIFRIPDDFRFSAKQWAAIACELPPGADQDRCRRDLEASAKWIEIGSKLTRKQWGKRCKHLAEVARLLETELGVPAIGYACFPGDPEGCELHIAQMHDLAHRADLARQHFGRHGRGDLERRRFKAICHLLKIWTDAGGDLKTSWSKRDNTSTGAVVRYLEKTVAAFDDDLWPPFTANAAREAVRKYERAHRG